MKVLAIGDFHGKFPLKLQKVAKDVDLVLCTGDLGGSDKLLKIIFKNLGGKWWETVGPKKAREYVLEDYNSGKAIIKKLDSLGVPVHIIPGNWDFTSTSQADRMVNLKLVLYQNLVRKTKNLHWCNRRLRNIHGLEVMTFGGGIAPGAYLEKGGHFDKIGKREKFVKRDKRETDALMRWGKQGVDFLLAHYPPYGFFDVVRWKGENPMNGKHVGFSGYTKFIQKFQPRVMIFGHMHEYQGKKKVGDTILVATGSAKEGQAALIDYPDDRKGRIGVEFIK